MDGRFVYAVRTTGVFCRPTCSSRKPNRRNVSFFTTPEEAESAGFRACLRCTPKDAPVDTAVVLVEQMRSYIDQHIDEPLTLSAIGDHVGLSQWHVQRTFKKVTAMSPREYLSLKRTERLKASLRNGESVTRAIYDAGFNSSSVVYESSSAQLGMTPAAYKKGGQGVSIQFSVVPSAIGNILIAATERGVCSVTIGDNKNTLERALRDEFPNASIEYAQGGFEDWEAQLLAYVQGDATPLDLPLDVGGTAFQQKVWRALQDIPYGRTATYTDVAKQLDTPRAVRAVANACANNRAALAIPCHRVIRSDGGLGGYKWGMGRKKDILETERRNAEAS